MKQKNFLVLSLLTVAVLGVAVVSQRSGSDASAVEASGLLFPELDAHLNDIAEVKVEKFGKSATLRREGGRWVLTDRGNFPAKFEKVKELAMRVASLEIEEQKTSKKENHQKLGVAWPSTAEEGSEGAEAALVVIKDAAGKELAAVVTGKTQWMGSKAKVYARRLSEDQVWLCEPRGSLEVVPEAKNWIEPEIVKLENERVQSVAIEHQDGERVDIARSATDHTKFAVQAVPAGRTERYVGVANGVAQALGSGLTLEDVRAVTEIDFAQEPLAKTRFKTTDGQELLIELAKFEEKTWAKVSATYSEPPPEAGPAAPAEGTETPEGGTPAEPAPEEPKRDVAKETSELNERLAPWAFELASWRSDVLLRRMKDLLNDPTPPEEGSADAGLQGVLDDLGIEDEELTPVEPTTPPADEGGAPPHADDGHPH
jgi:hypothetical protein